MIRFVIILTHCIFAFMHLGCDSESSPSERGSIDPITGLVKSGTDADPVYEFEDDADMEAAIQQARDTLAEFVAALEDPRHSQTYFAVKKPFETIQGSREHIWVGFVRLEGEHFRGTLDNIPADVPNLKHGQSVLVRQDEISDWMIVDNGRLVGGFTLRVFRDRLPPDERAEFDRTTGLVY